MINIDIRLPEKNTATTNSIEVAVKALAGFVIGLVVVIWSTPGVQDAVLGYVQTHWLDVVKVVGIPSLTTGAVNLFFDVKKKGLANY